jgi:branched-chain amino acid aminotransferase
MYLVLAALAGPYFAGGFASISVVTETQQPRAVPGGIGEAKTGANYAAGMDAKARAKVDKFDEVLFLDALEHRYLEELSGMNVFIVERGERLVTPPLGGTILRGITRRSILEFASDLDLKAEERPLVIDDVVRGIDDGTITEMMAVGTAAVVTPIGHLTLHGKRHTLGDGTPGAVARRVYDAITGIQYGRDPDRREWMRVVRPPASS